MSQENENLEEPQAEEVEEQTEVEETAEVDPLEAALTEAADYKDKYLRAHADFANDILSVMYSFENALASMEESGDSSEVLEKMKEGVNLTHEQLKKVLEKNHIKAVECEGEFDPEVHQAIMQVESDAHETGDIVQVMQKGYTIKDRVLRPAMVSTCK